VNSTFSVYLRLGLDHILDLSGYDHILFVVALAALYTLHRWRHLLILVTAFTLGHSLTLALATLDMVRVDSGLVEFLIPLTILTTALLNIGETVLDPQLRETDIESRRVWQAKYVLAAAFGLIHGLGFSNFLRAVLGGEESLLLPLLAFNIGLEVGQIVILGVVLVLAEAATRTAVVSRRTWGLIVSALVVLITLTILF